MHNINLLAWRHLKRETLRVEVVRRWLLSFLLGFAVIGLLSLLINWQISAQQQDNQFLQSKLQELEQRLVEIDRLKKMKKAFLARMEIIEKLQVNRGLMVELFSTVAMLLPEGMYLIEFKRIGDQLILVGHAETNLIISNLLRQLEKSPLLNNPILNSVDTRPGILELPCRFTLTAQMQGVNT